MNKILTYSHGENGLSDRQWERALDELLAGRPFELIEGRGTYDLHARLVPVSKTRLRVEAWTDWGPVDKEFKRTIQDVIEIFRRTADYDDELFRSALLNNKHGGNGVALYSLVGMPKTVQGLWKVLNESEAMAEIDRANTAGFEELIRRLSRGEEGGPGSTTWEPWKWLEKRSKTLWEEPEEPQEPSDEEETDELQ